MHKILLAGALFILVGIISSIYVFYYQPQHKESLRESLRFSNTQTWNADYLKSAGSLTAAEQAVLNGIDIPPYPSNTSAETKDELALLHQYAKLRTPEKIAEIEAEVSISSTVFGTETIAVLADRSKRPYTAALIDKTSELLAPYLFTLKNQNDRVRPSYLDPTLNTALPVPEHPAYPSGHATQATLLALILSELDPQNSAAYFASADRIAQNREIAGLHYPSDSQAGKMIARQLFPIFLRNDAFAQLLEEAKTEWQ